jgi:hypothetical protein
LFIGVVLVTLLMACPGAKPELTLTITKPTADLTTNTNVSITLEIPGRTPDQFTALNLVLERKRASDPDTAYAPIATFDRTNPYPFNTTWGVKAETDGAYTLRARATYTAGGFSGDILSATSGPRGIVLDRQAPAINERLPAPDAKNVGVRSPIRVTFSKPILVSSLTDTSVKLLSNGVSVGRMLVLSTDGKTLTVTPGSVPSAPAKLEVALSDGITDAVGNKLSSAGTWSWDAPAFLPIGDPLVGVNGTSRATQPAMALDASGNPVVAFTDSLDGTNPRVFVNRWDGSRWQALGGALSGTPGDARGTSAPSLVVDVSGRLVVAWMQSESATEEAYRTFVWRWDGTAWKDLGNPRVSTYKNTLKLKPYLYFDNQNSVVVAAITEEPDPSCGGSDLCRAPHVRPYSLSRYDGSVWQTVSTDVPHYEDGVSLSFNSKNIPIVTHAYNVLLFPSPPTYSTVVSRLEGTTWADIGTLASKATPAILSSLTMDSKDNPVVFWRGDTTGSENIRVSRLNGANQQDFGSPFSSGYGLSLVLDRYDNPFTAWLKDQAKPTSDGKTITDVFFTRWNGSSWQAPVGPISANPGATSASGLQLALDSNGTPVLAWSEEDGSGGSKVYVYRFNL